MGRCPLPNPRPGTCPALKHPTGDPAGKEAALAVTSTMKDPRQGEQPLHPCRGDGAPHTLGKVTGPLRQGHIRKKASVPVDTSERTSERLFQKTAKTESFSPTLQNQAGFPFPIIGGGGLGACLSSLQEQEQSQGPGHLSTGPSSPHSGRGPAHWWLSLEHLRT